jgi:hypothetical protein
MPPASSGGGGGGGDGCEHITYTYNGQEHEVYFSPSDTLTNLTDNQFGNNYTFNSPITIGDHILSAAGLFKLCRNFNSTIDLSNAVNLISVYSMLYHCSNYNLPIIFPYGSINNYSSMLSNAYNYDRAINFLIGLNSSTYTSINQALENCFNFNSKITFTMFNNLTNTHYTGMLRNAHSFNQPLILKQAFTCDSILRDATSMSCPIIIDLIYRQINIGSNILNNSLVNTVIILNYNNHQCSWFGSVDDMKYYVSDPDIFINKCSRLHKNINKLNFEETTNGYRSIDEGINVYVLNNVGDACNEFNNVWYNYYNEYPIY